MALNRSQLALLLGVLTILSSSSYAVRRSSLPVRDRPMPVSPDYSNDVPNVLHISSTPEQSARLSVEHLAQVMDQFHNRFAVYDDVSSAGNHFFTWTKFPGGTAPVNVNGSFTGNPHSGATAIQCSFTPTGPFGGFVFQNGTLSGTSPIPQPNFGTEPNAGINLTGATALTFWARGKNGGEVVDFFMGGVGRNSQTGNVNNPCTPAFSGPCPAPDSTRAIKITKTLTAQWQQFRIELNNVPLNYVLGGFGWGVDGVLNSSGAEFYLDDIQYELNSTRLTQRMNEPRFLRSFTTLPFQVQPNPVNDFDLVLRNSAFVYDNAIALLAFLADGSPDSLRRAQLIGDAFVYASQHDRAYNDGRLRTDYSAGDISLPPGWTPNGRPGTVPVSGYYDEAQQKFIEIEQKAIDTGNNTWAMIALLALYQRTSTAAYLTTARNLGNFVHSFRNDAGAFQGFQGGLDNYPETPMFTRRTYASTEHNLDVFSAFSRMSEITGESQWQADAQHAKQFVEAMWDTQKRCYLAGTTDPNTRNQVPDQLPLDVQAWSTLAVPDTVQLHPQVLECAEQNHRHTHNGFSGFDFNNDKDGVWFEGTGQMATAYAFALQSTLALAIREELSRAQQTPLFGDTRGVTAASLEGLTTGFDFKYFRRLHIGATAWNVFAQLGYNPFYQTTAPSVQFGQLSYIVSEGTSHLDITVNRMSATGVAASVDYATSDASVATNCSTPNTGNASSRCDYQTTLGKLQFAAGEASKTISILLVDDSYAEGNETFTVSLSNASGSGATLASPAIAKVTINDNETVNGTNPIDQAAFFVRQHYIDFFSREPDAAGLAFWTNQITECEQPGATCSAEVRRINVSAAFFLSIEFQETGYLVERLYKSAYGEATGTSNFGPTHQLLVPIVRFNEFLPDTQQIGNGVVIGQPGADQLLESNKVAFIAEFVQRTRFTTAYPSTLAPAQFVDTLFTNSGVTPSASERTLAIDEFGGAGTSADVAARARALRKVAENASFKQQEINKAFVLMQYFGYLRRNPNDPQDTDYSGYDFWLTKLNQFNGNFVNAEMVKAFIISGEYRARFGP